MATLETGSTSLNEFIKKPNTIIMLPKTHQRIPSPLLLTLYNNKKATNWVQQHKP